MTDHVFRILKYTDKPRAVVPWKLHTTALSEQPDHKILDFSTYFATNIN